MALPISDLTEAMRNHYDPQRYTAEMQEVWARTPDKADQIELPYYGFDHVDFCMGHGDLVSGHYNNWLREQTGGDVGRGIGNARETSGVEAPQVYQPELTEDWYPTRYIGNQTVSWLEEHTASKTDQPFFIQCSFPDPHHPFTPPGDYYSMYSPDDVSLPDSYYTPNKDATPPVRRLWDEYEAGKENKRWTWPFVTGEAEARLLASVVADVEEEAPRRDRGPRRARRAPVSRLVPPRGQRASPKLELTGERR